MQERVETNIARTTERLNADDASLRVVRVSVDDNFLECRFAEALARTRAPLEELCLHGFRSFYVSWVVEFLCLATSLPTLRVLRVCQCGRLYCDVPVYDLMSLAARPSFRTLVVYGERLSVKTETDLRALGDFSAEQEWVARAVGSEAARLLRRFVVPRVLWAHSSECVCVAPIED
jgi:hypothetical protein